MESGVKHFWNEMTERASAMAEGAKDAAEGLAALEKKQPDMAFVDLRLPDADGIALLATIKALYPTLPVVIISAHGDIRVAVEAV